MADSGGYEIKLSGSAYNLYQIPGRIGYGQGRNKRANIENKF